MQSDQFNSGIYRQSDLELKTELYSQEQTEVGSQDDISSNSSQKFVSMDFDEIIRQQMLVPIRPLGRGAFGIVYLVYNHNLGLQANKITKKNKFNKKEWEAVENIRSIIQSNPFILNHFEQKEEESIQILYSSYSNMNTLDILAKNQNIQLPMNILRALMQQILEGMRLFHGTGQVHRDIKCDNILLHCPNGSGLVYAKISDFGFAKKEDLIHEQTYHAGTLPYMSPEQFQEKAFITQKVDIYATGITLYKLITHKFPVNERNFKEQGKKMAQLKCIDRPPEIKDDRLWDLLSKILEFDPSKRISAAEALKHPFFTSPEAIADISPEQHNLADQVKAAQNLSIFDLYDAHLQWTTNYDLNPLFIVPYSEILKLIPNNLDSEENPFLHQFSSQNYQQTPTLKQNIAEVKQIDNNDDNLYELTSVPLDKQSNSVYSPQSHIIKSSNWTQHFEASIEQLQAEKDLLEMDMSLEQIKEKLDKFESLSKLQLDIICAIL
ncbi:MAG: putative Serine/threonine-protein kinase ATG1a, partial [Streblomastix strix]